MTAMMAVVVFMMVVMPASAQTNAMTGAVAETEIKYFDFFVVKGGPIAFGLIALSIVTIALTIEHCLSIR